jgi:hypothetical protein
MGALQKAGKMQTRNCAALKSMPIHPLSPAIRNRRRRTDEVTEQGRRRMGRAIA